MSTFYLLMAQTLGVHPAHPSTAPLTSLFKYSYFDETFCNFISVRISALAPYLIIILEPSGLKMT